MEAFRPVLTIITLLILLVSEMAWSYRRPSVSKLKRWITNISLTVFNSILLYVVFAGAAAAVIYVTTNKVGLLNLFDMPGRLKMLATVVCMDFFLYV